MPAAAADAGKAGIGDVSSETMLMPRNAIRIFALAAIAVAFLDTPFSRAQVVYADTAPPPDWTASDWNALMPAEQTLELTDYDDGKGDPAAKKVWIASHPESEIDSELNASLDSEGVGSLETATSSR